MPKLRQDSMLQFIFILLQILMPKLRQDSMLQFIFRFNNPATLEFQILFRKSRK